MLSLQVGITLLGMLEFYECISEMNYIFLIKFGFGMLEFFECFSVKVKVDVKLIIQFFLVYGCKIFFIKYYFIKILKVPCTFLNEK